MSTTTVVKPEQNQKVDLLPQWNVILLDDDDHSYEYVIDMLMDVFAHPVERAFQMAVEVDNTGQVIVDTTNYERALLKQEQIHSYGPDPYIEGCKGSMTAICEPAE